METVSLAAVIDAAFERRAEITPGQTPVGLAQALDQVIDGLNAGYLRVAEKIDGVWVTHQWVKKAVLLYFRTHDNQVMTGPGTSWFDKVPMRFQDFTDARFRDGGFRVVPPAVARTGTYIGPNVVMMPSYVNIGAYVGAGTMVDTWATVGSCAQIGKNVHLSGGVGIGGVLEPLQANPTIVEDNCFVVDSPQELLNCRIERPLASQTQLKLYGSYDLPAGFVVSGVFRNEAGLRAPAGGQTTSIEAVWAAPNAVVAPALGRNLAACGTRVPCTATTSIAIVKPYTLFEGRLNQMDLRLTRSVTMGRSKLQANLDLYNAFNRSPVVGVVTGFGASWLRPSQILDGRLIQVSANLTF